MKLADFVQEQLGREDFAPTDKQILVMAHRQGVLSQAALRICAKELDAYDGRAKRPVLTIARRYDAGEIEVRRAEKKQGQKPRLSEVPTGQTPKQNIAFLFRAGSLSQQHARDAARKVNELQNAGKDIDLAEILRSVGATEVVDGPEEEKPEAGSGAGPDSEETTADEDGEADGDEDQADSLYLAVIDGEEVEVTPVWPEEFEEGIDPDLLYETGVESIEYGWMPLFMDIPTLALLKEWEKRHPKYEGGRSMVFDAIEDRIGEIKTDPIEGTGD